MGIKVRLAVLGKTQVDLLKAVRKKGFETLSYGMFSSYVNEMRIQPKGERVLAACEEVLAQWESAPKAAGE